MRDHGRIPVRTGSPGRLSAARVRALCILHPQHPLDPELFAHYMWPTSPSWHARHPGRGAYLKARSFLSRLESEGLVTAERAEGCKAYRVSPLGERLTSGARPQSMAAPSSRSTSAPPTQEPMPIVR